MPDAASRRAMPPSKAAALTPPHSTGRPPATHLQIVLLVHRGGAVAWLAPAVQVHAYKDLQHLVGVRVGRPAGTTGAAPHGGTWSGQEPGSVCGTPRAARCQRQLMHGSRVPGNVHPRKGPRPAGRALCPSPPGAHLTMRHGWPRVLGATTHTSDSTSVFSPSSGYGTVRLARLTTSCDSAEGGSMGSPSCGTTSWNLAGVGRWAGRCGLTQWCVLTQGGGARAAGVDRSRRVGEGGGEGTLAAGWHRHCAPPAPLPGAQCPGAVRNPAPHPPRKAPTTHGAHPPAHPTC